MKTLMKLRRSLSTLIAAAMVLFAACSDPVLEKDDDDNDPQDSVVTTAEADEIAGALLFKDGTKVTGTLPDVVKTFLTRTNSRDTIYVTEGVKIPIRVSHPEAKRVAGIFFHVKGSTFYHDVPTEIEEESDTVSTLFVDIDNLQIPPASVQGELVPYDDSKQPIDIIERTITIEEPSETCDFLIDRPGTLGDTSGSWTPRWYWNHTVVFGPTGDVQFFNAPGATFRTATTYQGCCDFSTNKNCNILSTTLNATADVVISYAILSESFAFYTDGTFARKTHERKQNFNPVTTDWCSGVAGYMISNDVVTYLGTHDYVPGDNNISYVAKYVSCDLCGYGSPGGLLLNTCNVMAILRVTEGSSQIRVYTRDSVIGFFD